MNGVDQTAQSRVQAAEDRLTRAINRLEAALEKRANDSLAVQTPPQNDGEVRSDVQHLQAENAELRALVETAAERLDGTIAKFKAKLVR